MTPAYHLRDIAWGYTPGPPTLLLDELNIEAGRLTALLGANGAGKSTLFGILALLHPLQAGEMDCLGQRLGHGTAPLALRRRVTLLTQHPRLLSGSVLDNVALGLELRGMGTTARRRRATRMLTDLGVAHLARRDARTLSGGERQLVALARTVAPATEIVLCDEPFAALEQDAAARVENLLTRLAREEGRTVLFSTHDTPLGLSLAERVITLNAGTLGAPPVLNLFRGRSEGSIFRTGRIDLHLPDDLTTSRVVTLQPEDLMLSRAPLKASARNRFRGRISAIAAHGARVLVTIDAGEIFQALITPAAREEMNLATGDLVWVSFKATAIRTP